MSELPAFNIDANIHPSDAWHDKIEWCLQAGLLLRQREAPGFLYHIACPDSFSREPQNPSIAFGWLLGPSAGNRGGYTRSIRKQAFRWGDTTLQKPLFSGDLKLRRVRRTRVVEFWLQINPSRVAHHHPTPPTGSDEIWMHSNELSSAHPESVFEGEFSLDGKDNWIPQTPAYSRKRSRPASAAARCLRLIQEAIFSEVARSESISATDMHHSSDQPHSLLSHETYWEFTHSDPTRLIASLKGPLRRFSRMKFQTRRYKRRGADGENQDSNCFSIIVPLGKGETLSVYAKTNQRVRFEIRQEFIKRGGRAPAILAGGHTAASMRDFKRLLKRVRVHCAERMNSLFAFLRAQSTIEPDAASTVTFLADLASVLKRSENFATVLSLLLTNDGIVNVPGLKSEIGSLKRAGIIELNGARQTASYNVTARYRDALTKLQHKGLASEFVRVTRDR